MERNKAYSRFKNTLRPDVKLKLSLEEYIRICNKGTGTNDEDARIAEEYREYLANRRRAAWELLIREENLDGLRIFAREQWIGSRDVQECLNLAVRLGKRESQLWLLRYLKNRREILEDTGGGADESVSGENVSQKVFDEEQQSEIEICEEILRLLRIRLQSQIPALASAFPCLSYREVREKKSDEKIWGTDGRYLYYAREELYSLFAAGMGCLGRAFLHSLFHCLYLHVICFQAEAQMDSQVNSQINSPVGLRGRGDRDWNLACDLATEWAVDESGWFPLEATRQKKRNAWYRSILDEEKSRDTKACHRWIKKRDASGQAELLKEMEVEFTVDRHSYWYEKGNTKKVKDLTNNENLASVWGHTRQNISMQLQGNGQHAGRQGGAGEQEYRAQKKKIYDYRKFLKQFAVCREEMQLDMESFDYIPYSYGLERYGNILLVEPLETTEVNRLEEFVIAIDTSGSCSGETVCRFLDETYRILSSRENFFRKMNVHIIQCDSVIQDHRKITCREDWEEYQENVKIQGLGGTDFTPVFRLVDQMLEKKEIRNLKGLLYFTDGDGVFPRKKPAYETAFVFLNRALEKSRIPDWAIRLNLEM